MVQPVHSHTFEGVGDLAPTPARQPSSGPPPATKDASQIPDVSHLTRPGTAPQAPVRGPVPAGPSPRVAAAIQTRLDAFLAAATPTYHTPEGDVSVAAPFRIRRGFTVHEADVVQPNQSVLHAVAKSIGMTEGEITVIQAGRATPAQIRRLTQGLVDSGKLPLPGKDTPAPLAGRLRQMMFDFGIGLDCAGYVRQAFVASHPDVSGVSLRAPVNESLSGLAARGFFRLPLSQARTGDIIVLNPPSPREYGHTLIVHDARPATLADREQLKDLAQTDDKVRRIQGSDRLSVLVVDSSWGSWGSALRGGASRQTWFQDARSGQWLGVHDKERSPIVGSLYGHTVEGVYRAPGGH